MKTYPSMDGIESLNMDSKYTFSSCLVRTCIQNLKKKYEFVILWLSQNLKRLKDISELKTHLKK